MFGQIVAKSRGTGSSGYIQQNKANADGLHHQGKKPGAVNSTYDNSGTKSAVLKPQYDSDVVTHEQRRLIEEEVERFGEELKGYQ